MKVLKKGWRELFPAVDILYGVALDAGKIEYAGGISCAMDMLEMTLRYKDAFGEEVKEEMKPVYTEKNLAL